MLESETIAINITSKLSTLGGLATQVQDHVLLLVRKTCHDSTRYGWIGPRSFHLESSRGGVGTPEVQVVRIGSSDTSATTISGSFRLKLYSHLETNAITFDATAEDIKTELETSFVDASHPQIEVEVMKVREDNIISYVIAFTRGRPGSLDAEMKIGDVSLLVDVMSVTQVADVDTSDRFSTQHSVCGKSKISYLRRAEQSNRTWTKKSILSVISADIDLVRLERAENHQCGSSRTRNFVGYALISEIGCSPLPDIVSTNMLVSPQEDP